MVSQHGVCPKSLTHRSASINHSALIVNVCFGEHVLLSVIGAQLFALQDTHAFDTSVAR